MLFSKWENKSRKVDFASQLFLCRFLLVSSVILNVALSEWGFYYFNLPYFLLLLPFMHFLKFIFHRSRARNTKDERWSFFKGLAISFKSECHLSCEEFHFPLIIYDCSNSCGLKQSFSPKLLTLAAVISVRRLKGTLEIFDIRKLPQPDIITLHLYKENPFHCWPFNILPRFPSLKSHMLRELFKRQMTIIPKNFYLFHDAGCVCLCVKKLCLPIVRWL
jgi:hypothetical protein